MKYPHERTDKRTHTRGQISVEYILILVLVVLLLIHGNPSPLEQFFDAIKDAYQRFTFAMSAV